MALPNAYTNLTLNDSLEDSRVASADIRQYARVKLQADGTIQEAANIADYSIGVARAPILNTYAGPIRLHLPMQYGLANANINVGDPLVIATGGLVSPTLANTTSVVGVAKTPTNTGSNIALAYYGVRNGAASA